MEFTHFDEQGNALMVDVGDGQGHALSGIHAAFP